jgi:hypothetical protein
MSKLILETTEQIFRPEQYKLEMVDTFLNRKV